MMLRGGVLTTGLAVVLGACSGGRVEGLSAPPGYPTPAGHGAAWDETRDHEATEPPDEWYRAGRGTQWQGARTGPDEDNVGPLRTGGRDTQWNDDPGTTVMDLLDKSESLGAFTLALKRTGMDAELEKAGPFTVFAPIDFAFEQMSTEYKADLFGPNGDDRLRDLVRRHIVVGQYSEEDLAVVGEVTSLAGTKISVHDIGGVPEPGGAQVLASRTTKSGTIHQIDRLIEP
jgi:uncharacterized surface protein with fasciclin (FAS1) repeats